MSASVHLIALSARVALKKVSRERRASAISARVACTLTPRERRAHALSSRILARLTRREVQTPALSGRYMLRMNPDFRWIDMFKDIVFPHDISEGSDGAARFSTLVNEVTSGHDQRNSLWDYPKMEYNIAYGVRTMEQLHDLIRFFRVSRGKLYSFRFLDKVDYTSSFATLEEARAADDITPLDQRIAVGDGETVSFQLTKTYDFGSESATRPIYKPIQDTVRLAINTAEITNFEVNHSTGIVTIVPRVIGDVVDGLIEIVDIDTFHWRIIMPGVTPDDPETPGDETVGTPLPVFNANERIILTSPQLNAVIKGTVISSTATTLEFYWPEGTDIYARGPNTDFHLESDSTPKIGDIITAGYQFHVPVRFNTDRIPVRLEYYGVGSANEITLVEVRPDEM